MTTATIITNTRIAEEPIIAGRIIIRYLPVESTLNGICGAQPILRRDTDVAVGNPFYELIVFVHMSNHTSAMHTLANTCVCAEILSNDTRMRLAILRNVASRVHVVDPRRTKRQTEN